MRASEYAALVTEVGDQHIAPLAGNSTPQVRVVLGALALARLIDNSVVVLENIFRHLEGGESPEGWSCRRDAGRRRW